MKFQFNDGGRKEAGYKGLVGDCVVRAVVIANDLDYKTTYRKISLINANTGRGKTVRRGVIPSLTNQTLRDLGWKKLPMDRKLRFRADNLPKRKKLIIQTRRHVCAVIDGVLMDTWDSTKSGDALIESIWVRK